MISQKLLKDITSLKRSTIKGDKMQILNKKPLCYEVDKDLFVVNDRLDTWFFLPHFITLLEVFKETNFEICKIGDKKISLKLIDGIHKKPDYRDTGLIFIQVNNIKEGKIDFFNNVKYVSKEWEKLVLDRYTPEHGDILITKDGTIGIAAVVPENPQKFSIFVSVAAIRPNKQFIIPKYLEIFLNGRLGQMQIDRYTRGAVLAHLLLEEIRKIKIPLPPKNVQKEIIKITEDARAKRKQNLKKIESLRKKLDGFFLKELSLEYPEEKEENVFITELDERLDPYYYHLRFKQIFDFLKKGKFELKKLKDVARFSGEQVDPKKEPNRLFKYIQIRNIDEVNHKISSYTHVLGKDAPGRARMLIREGDILLPILGGSLKSVAIVPKEFNDEVATNGFAILRISDKNLRYYVFYYLITKFAQMQIKRKLTGAIMSSISKSELENVLIPLPASITQERVAKKIMVVSNTIKKFREDADDVINKAVEEVEKMIIGG